MAVHVYMSELEDAVLFASASDSPETAAYVSRETGRIYWRFEPGTLDPEDEELPADVEDGSLYASVPNDHDLDLGQRLVWRFVEDRAPDLYDEVRSFFSRRGAWGRYKGLLDRRGLLQAWHDFEEESRHAALRTWAEQEGFEIVDGRRP